MGENTVSVRSKDGARNERLEDHVRGCCIWESRHEVLLSNVRTLSGGEHILRAKPRTSMPFQNWLTISAVIVKTGAVVNAALQIAVRVRQKRPQSTT